MNPIYLDNAATTPVYDVVNELMFKTSQEVYGNPSSTHLFGRKAKSMIENSRKQIAKLIGSQSNEIIFTSCGTEADNLILFNAVNNLGVKHIISSPIEHHAVLHTLEEIEKQEKAKVTYLDIDEFGIIDYNQLESLLVSSEDKVLVSLMYVNNEIGNILDVDRVTFLTKKYEALFHTDAVQAVGHFPIQLEDSGIDFLAASAHKFHGPKGIGFAYFRKGFGIKPIIHGGEQEKGVRAGTENLVGIVGMEKALSISLENLEEDIDYIKSLKVYFINELRSQLPELKFNGLSADIDRSTPTVINVQLPKEYAMLLFSLDLKGIAVSGGSACQSGSNKGSHVLEAILNDVEVNNTSIRFSLSKFNTKEEIDTVVQVLKDLV